MSYADAVDQLARACGTDLAKYCKGIELGARLKTCLDANQARLSPQCAQTRAAVYASISRRAAAQRNIGDICDPDIAQTLRHLARRCSSRRMPAQRIAGGDEPAMQSDIHRYRLAYGKGTAMKRHHIYVAAALIFASGLTAAVAQNAINSAQMANSLAAVSATANLLLTGAQMRQAVLDRTGRHTSKLARTSAPSPTGESTRSVSITLTKALANPKSTAFTSSYSTC